MNDCIDRYKELLGGILIDGEVSEKKKILLEKYRHDHSITQAEHKKMLQELGWSLVEYEVGIRNGPSKASLIEYETMLSKAIHKESEVKVIILAILPQLNKQMCL